MSLIPPAFLDYVVAIGYRNSEGVQWGATGFFYGRRQYPERPDDPNYHILLVTARHVLQGRNEIIIRLNPAPGVDAKQFPARLVDETGRQAWRAHPTDDVAILPISTNVLTDNGVTLRAFLNDKHVLLLDEVVAQHALSEGDGVFVLGFPMGQLGGDRNYTVVRSGCIARVRDCLAKTARTFLVDATVFPGTSGGPVLTRPEVISIQGTDPIKASYLIGVVSAYLPYIDRAISQQTQRARITFEENSGLAEIVPIDRVHELVERALAEEMGRPATQQQRG